MIRLIGIGLLLIAAYLIKDNVGFVYQTPKTGVEKLRDAIENNVSNSLLQAGIPASNGIFNVDLKFRSEKAHEILKLNRPYFQTSKEGKISLEIEFIDLPDPQTPGLITQTSVFDVKSKNKIAEFGNSYDLKKYGLNEPTSVTTPKK